jgi:chromosomal replication initiation ATPase DnaA
MYLARELTGQSFPQIGRMFGDRHHTTAMFAVTKIGEMEAADEKLAAALNECRARIAQLVSERIGKMVTMQATSSDWSPPPPTRGMVLSKPSTVIASIDGAAWLACAA